MLDNKDMEKWVGFADKEKNEKIENTISIINRIGAMINEISKSLDSDSDFVDRSNISTCFLNIANCPEKCKEFEILAADVIGFESISDVPISSGIDILHAMRVQVENIFRSDSVRQHADECYSLYDLVYNFFQVHTQLIDLIKENKHMASSAILSVMYRSASLRNKIARAIMIARNSNISEENIKTKDGLRIGVVLCEACISLIDALESKTAGS